MNSIEEKIEQAPKVDFGNILSRSFEFFKEVWQEGFYHVLVSLIVVIPFVIVVYAPFIPIYIDMLDQSYYGGYNSYNEPFFVENPWMIFVYILVIFVMAIIMQVITIAITAHFYQVCKSKDLGTPPPQGGYFDAFRRDFGKVFMLSLATFGIALVATLLCYLPIFYAMVPLQLIVPIYAFNRELSVSDIIRAAFKLGNKYWITVFGLVIISSMIAQVGVLLCIIGVFFTAYFVHIPVYLFYKDSVGFDENVSQIEN